jgi:hypothetical protein
MSSKAAMFQITQQLRVFAGRISRAERDQQAAVTALQLARSEAEAAADALEQAKAQLVEANTEFAVSAASEQARIWRDTMMQRQAEAKYHLEQCQFVEAEATEELNAANRALQKLQLQNDQILARQGALTKTKQKRQEAAIEDDRNAANRSANAATGL